MVPATTVAEAIPATPVAAKAHSVAAAAAALSKNALEKAKQSITPRATPRPLKFEEALLLLAEYIYMLLEDIV